MCGMNEIKGASSNVAYEDIVILIVLKSRQFWIKIVLYLITQATRKKTFGAKSKKLIIQ